MYVTGLIGHSANGNLHATPVPFALFPLPCSLCPVPFALFPLPCSLPSVLCPFYAQPCQCRQLSVSQTSGDLYIEVHTK